MTGWIKLHRALTDHDLWLGDVFTRGQAWVDLLMLANHRPGHIRRRGIRVSVNRGQVGYSQEAIAQRWRWSRGKVIRFLTELKRDERISLETELKNVAVTALITITNFDQYQGNGTEDDTENGPKTEPKTVLEQECKEGKEKISVRGKFTPPSQTEVQAYMADIGFDGDADRFVDFYASKGWMVGRNKMKDWKAAVRTWRKGQSQQTPPPSTAGFLTIAEVEALP
ncbi:hypothetical protein L4X63_20460 [Geomonas sp. Red32]|uniref:hypothetical protein n=1 Tax=Geomonas sp. Red32 TaxID=2912856 RepID=UPI00202D04C3|nr:hypothetical protein [Geomonas sp. Red32]MCM0083959.1 hypothetical protein [Geomonas sp. Red32]